MEIIKQKIIILEIINCWKAIPIKYRPWGMWVRLYDPIDPFNNECNLDSISTLRRVWFFDKMNFVEKNIWDYKRFITIHGTLPWCTRIWKEPCPIFGDPAELGFAGFTEYKHSNEIYLEEVWGGRYGAGYIIKVINQEKIELIDKLWVS